MAIEVDDDRYSAGLEALRSKHGPIMPAMVAVTDPDLKGVSIAEGGINSRAHICCTTRNALRVAELKKAAVDSVQAGLIASLDRDCRNYRAQIKNLTRQIEAMGVQFEARNQGLCARSTRPS